MEIAIITAMPEETGAIVRLLKQTEKISIGGLKAYQARFDGHDIVVAEAGMGFVNATSAARQLVRRMSPDLLVSAGFCGGITEGLQVGDAVLASGVTVVSGNNLQEVTVSEPDWCRDYPTGAVDEGGRLFSGLFVTVRTIMEKKRLATLLPPEVSCPVVEMESGAIAIVAAENDIPFIGLRTVSDTYDEELGFSLDEFCDDSMRIRIPRVLLTIARKPRIIPQLIRLAGNSRVAAASLSRSMERLLAVMQ